MATCVKGDWYEKLDGKLLEIKRQMRQFGGYPYDPARLDRALQALIEGRFEAVGDDKKSAVFQITYDQSVGSMELIQRAVGPNNIRYISPDITSKRFPLKGTDVRTVNVRVEPFLDGETGEQAAERLVAAGHVLANTGDLAGFLLFHPKEVEKWNWVVALSEDSRWAEDMHDHGHVCVPSARVDGAALRLFRLSFFRTKFRSSDGVLVLCE